MKRTVGSFRAVDENRRHFDILEMVEVVNVGEPNAQADDLSEYFTANGQRVNKISDTEFEIVSTGRRLRVIGLRSATGEGTASTGNGKVQK